jgi:hypothetical protein
VGGGYQKGRRMEKGWAEDIKRVGGWRKGGRKISKRMEDGERVGGGYQKGRGREKGWAGDMKRVGGGRKGGRRK